MNIIITRPCDESAHWAEQLAAHGFNGVQLPLIEIAPLTERASLQRVWKNMSSYDALMFVSGNAVSHFFKSNQALGHDLKAIFATNSGVRFLAPGPATHAALVQAGVPSSRIDAPSLDAAQFDSEALWCLIGQRHWHGKRVVLVRGQGAALGNGREWLAAQFQAAGAQIEFLEVYERRAPTWSAAQLAQAQAALQDGSVWLFSSSQALAYLQTLLPGSSAAQARAVATHPRIAQALREAGWGVVAPSRPVVADIVAAVRSL